MSETETSFDRCRCCLEDGELRDLWGEYIRNGERTNYGEMIVNCFVLPWQQPSDYMEQICEVCIEKLQDAFSFKKKVLASELVLQQQMSYESENIEKKPTAAQLKIKVEPKSENPDVIKGHYSDEACEEENENVTYYVVENNADTMAEDSQDMSMEDGEYCEETMSSVNQDDESAEYLEVEFLDDCDNAAKQTTEETSTKRKWPKKKKKSEQMSTYKQYTKEDLQKAMEAVKNNLMSRSEAARLYNVPVKTLGSKLRVEATKIDNPEISEEEEQRLQNQEKHNRFIEEIKTILTYTNSTPYRSKAGRYNCAYCSVNDFFENPDDLRTHTRTKHASDRLRAVEEFMKPSWLNEIIKLDIENLNCVICCAPIESWNDMFKHLKDNHDVDLDEAYTRVIPFKLTEQLTCALCSEKFPNYHTLDSHMNAHYNNYICGECGDTFLSESRMKKHTETHRIGRFPCTHCDKVFSLDKYRKKHIDGVHCNEAKVKCPYCAEKFRGEYARHLHQLEVHQEKIKTIKCELCPKTFDWRPYYLKHMRLNHNKKEKKHKCTLCSKQFSMRYELKNHEEWHKGVKNVCVVCGKNFCTKQYLQKHYKIHMDENTDTILIL